MPAPKLEGFEQMRQLNIELEKRQFDFSNTRNELSECKPVTVIFARGTIELGNVGAITGPPFFNALDLVIGAENVAIQGVDYPATILGYLEGGDKGGASTLASLTEQAANQCPDTQIVLSGYSQGAQVVHLGAAQISPETAARVAAVVSCSISLFITHFAESGFQVLFGDPKKGQAFPSIDESKVDTFCFVADLICDALPVVDSYHLSYAVDATPAAQFVAQHVSV